MRKYTVQATFGLSTSIEPDGVRFDRYSHEGVEDLEDNSYFGSADVDVDGGEITFVVEAESDDDAERKAEAVIFDGYEVEDDSGIAWVTTDVSITVEAIEVPMTLERAREILAKLAEGYEDGEVAEAVAFVFNHLASLTSRIEGLEAGAQARSELPRV